MSHNDYHAKTNRPHPYMWSSAKQPISPVNAIFDIRKITSVYSKCLCSSVLGFCYIVNFVNDLRFCSHSFARLDTKLNISGAKIRKSILRYNKGIMARPSKFNEDSVGRFLELIAGGCTVKDAASDIQVSEMTISRWRKSHKEFDKAVLSAMREGWDYAANLKADGYRTYRKSKETYTLPAPPEKAHTAVPVASQGHVSAYHQQKYIMGLPIKPRPHTYDYDVPPFVNPDTWQVEQIIKGVLQACPLWVWERKRQPKQELPFIVEWF